MGRPKTSMVPASAWQAGLLARMEADCGSMNAFCVQARINRSQVRTFLVEPDPNPQLETLRAIAGGFGLTVAEILPPQDRPGIEPPAPPTQREAEALAMAKDLQPWQWHSLMSYVTELHRLSEEVTPRKKRSGRGSGSRGKRANAGRKRRGGGA